MNARPLTPEELQQKDRERMVELVWKLKLLTPEEITDLVVRLEAEAPEILKALRS